MSSNDMKAVLGRRTVNAAAMKRMGTMIANAPVCVCVGVRMCACQREKECVCV